MNINEHPFWKGIPLWRQINPIKKQAHLFRFFMARQYAKLFPRSMFVGVTGSVGKTTATLACREVLSQKYKTISTKPNLDPILNIPITLLNIRPKVKKVVLEMGIEYQGDMDFYLSFVKPQSGIVTRVSFVHSEFLGKVTDIALEKGKLIQQLPKDGFAILNWDDPIVRKFSDKTSAQVIFYGTDPKNCHLWAGNMKIVDLSLKFELNYGVERIEVRSKLLGLHQVYPLMAAAALGISLNFPLTTIKKALERVEPEEHRMQVKPGYNGSVIIDDSHNADFSAMEQAIDTLNYIPARRRIVVLGEMRELGSYTEKLHRLIAQKIFKDKIDLVFLGTANAKIIAEELINLGFINERIFENLQNPQIVSKLIKTLSKGDVVLVKGARALRLDEVVARIVKSKGRN